MQMALPVEIALLCILYLVWIRDALCDGIPTNSAASKWTCTCSVAGQENSNFVSSNCSSSCDCSPAAGQSVQNRWTCICSTGGLPRLVGEDNGTNCFSACNCNAGTLPELQPSKKRISSKVIMILLLLCIVLTVLAFIGSVLWHVYRKDKSPIQWASSSSDGFTSSSSATNLTSQGASSVPIHKGYLDSPVKPIIGCIPRTSFPFRSRTGAIHGTIIQFSYSELESATNKFSNANLIGVGGSSHVYCGNLTDGQMVAIKRMKTQAGPDAEHVFLTEIKVISRLNHCHVVPLLGYCSENQGKHAERLLVFEYVPNGNLRECLDGESGQSLDWNTRVAIAIDAARGLEYLHEAAAPRILHRDVKSTNILLDEKWRAKITDLGMAKHLHNDGILSCSSSPARMQGTFGYFAPEYAIVGRASLKSDVFSFGVVLLELVTGRMPIHKSADKGEESLVIWAMPRLHDSKRVALELPDPRLKGAFEEEELQVMAYLAKECLLLDPDSRPNMTEVVQILSTITPDKSKRKTLSVRSFQGSSTGKRSENPEPCDGELYYTFATEEIKQITSEKPTNPGKNDIENSSTDIEKLILLTSKSRSWRFQDVEMVDIAEPRFESFCLSNADSHIVKIT